MFFYLGMWGWGVFEVILFDEQENSLILYLLTKDGGSATADG